MWLRRRIVIALFASIPAICFSQRTDTLINKLDSLKKGSDTAAQVNVIDPGFYNEQTKLDARLFGILLLNDFKQQTLSPLDINKRGQVEVLISEILCNH
jgi:hypothetical protein